MAKITIEIDVAEVDPRLEDPHDVAASCLVEKHYDNQYQFHFVSAEWVDTTWHD